MSFLELVRREMHGSLPRLLVMSALGGLSTAAILAAINAGLQGNIIRVLSPLVIDTNLLIKGLDIIEAGMEYLTKQSL